MCEGVCEGVCVVFQCQNGKAWWLAPSSCLVHNRGSCVTAACFDLLAARSLFTDLYGANQLLYQ